MAEEEENPLCTGYKGPEFWSVLKKNCALNGPVPKAREKIFCLPQGPEEIVPNHLRGGWGGSKGGWMVPLPPPPPTKGKGGGDNFMREIFRHGKFRRGKFSPPLRIPKVTLPHAHTA